MPRNRRSVSNPANKSEAEVREIGADGAQNDDSHTRPVVQWSPYFAFIPVGFAMLTSINTLASGFAVDDMQQVLNNPSIKSFGNIPMAFLTSVWSFSTSDVVFAVDSYYRPLFNVLFTLNYWLFETSAWGWHLVNLAVHAAVCYLVFVVVRRVLREARGDEADTNWVALVAACLFALHPVHAESVAWISGVTDPFMALLVLPAFLLYLRFKATRKLLYLAAALAFYLLGLFCKETAVALPLLIGYLELWPLNGSDPLDKRVRGVLVAAGSFVIPTAIYMLMRWSALSGIFLGTAPRYSLKQAIATAPLAITKYLEFLFIPHGYSYQHYTQPVSSFSAASFVWPVCLLAAIVALIVISKSKLLAFAAIWFLIWLLPALVAIRQFDPEYLVQERYLYIPSIGFCLAIALGVGWLWRHALVGRIAAGAATVALLLLFGYLLILQNAVWKSSQTVFENCIAVDLDSPFGHASLAKVLFDIGRKREADAEAVRALDLAPQSPEPYLVLAYLANANGKTDKAIQYLERGTSGQDYDPMNRYRLATMLLNLGFLYEHKKENSLAERSMLRSLEVWPRAVGWYRVGQFYLDQERYDAAREMFEKALQGLPRRFAPIHLKLAKVYEKQGDAVRSRSEYQTYLRLAPNAPDRKEVQQKLSAL
jgi:tetratricopeptide (TPR) repeat protein